MQRKLLLESSSVVTAAATAVAAAAAATGVRLVLYPLVVSHRRAEPTAPH